MPILLLDGRVPGDVLRAARILREGGVVVIPTDTVYGLAASVLRPTSIERIFEIKRRPAEARVPILLGSAADLPILVREVPRIAWKLIVPFWPGGLTLVMQARSSVPEAITRGSESVAVRVPAARTTLELLQVLGEPVVGTSANVSGLPPIARAEDALVELAGIDAVLADDDAIVAGVPSTVVDLTEPTPVITRIGAVPADAIRDAIGLRVKVAQQLIRDRERA